MIIGPSYRLIGAHRLVRKRVKASGLPCGERRCEWLAGFLCEMIYGCCERCNLGGNKCRCPKMRG